MFLFLQSVDKDLALKIYIKARASPKVVVMFAQRQEFEKILIYSNQVWESTVSICQEKRVLWFMHKLDSPILPPRNRVANTSTYIYIFQHYL